MPSGSTAEESELARFFMQHAASGLAGILDADFWTSILPQLSSSWQSIRFALFSISALTRGRCRLVYKHTTTTSSISKTPSAVITGMKFYRKALAASREELAFSNRTDLAIMTCILFFCIECLQGRRNGAIALCRSGQTILDQTHESPPDATCYYDRLVTSMRCMFARVRIVATLHGQRVMRLPRPTTPIEEHEAFENLCEARWALLTLTNDVLSLQHQAAETYVYGRSSRSEITAVEELQDELLQTLKAWHWRANRFLLSDILASIHRQLARLVLHCHYIVINVMLGCLLATSELCWDGFTDSFQQIVESCSQIIKMKGEADDKQYSLTQFQLDSGIMLPLFLTACKCRAMNLRREALNLMKQSPQQEGLWERDRVVRVAGRIMEIEADGTLILSMPDEYNRLIHFHMDPDHGRTSAGKPAVSVSFVQRLQDRSRRIWEELLVV